MIDENEMLQIKEGYLKKMDRMVESLDCSIDNDFEIANFLEIDEKKIDIKSIANSINIEEVLELIRK